MDSYIALMLFGSFFILVFIGVPISFSIGIATVGSMLLMFPWDIAVITVSQRLANGLDNFALLAIPFFIFAGTLMNSGGIAIRLINLAQVMVGRVPGSLGHVNVLANMMFGSISGSAVAAAAAVGESSAGLQEGDVMNLDAALKALLVPSGNDAAVAIAETIGALMEPGTSDPEAVFVNAMNAKAQELGCTDTVYDNPHGLDFDAYAGDLHSTAADVAKVVQYAMTNDTFRAAVGGGSTTIQVTRADGAKADIYLETTDGFFDIYEYAIGVKTGVTLLAGPSFAGAANKDAESLCEWVYQHEISYQLANSPETATMNGTEVPVVAEVAHSGWIDKTVKATLRDPAAAVTIFDLNGNVSQSLEFDELAGNVKEGDKVGTITFKQRNTVIATMDLVACEDVDAPDFFEGVGVWWDRLFRSFSGGQEVARSITLNETPLVIDKTASAA